MAEHLPNATAATDDDSDAPTAALPVIGPGHDYHSVTEKISSIVLTRHTGRGWLIGFAISFVLVMVLLASIGMLLAYGIGVWGLNAPVGWAFDITNFVWWI